MVSTVKDPVLAVMSLSGGNDGLNTVRGTKSGSILGSFSVKNRKKWYPKRHRKIDAEKVSKNDAKMTLNEAKMHLKFMFFSLFRKRRKCTKPLYL